MFAFLRHQLNSRIEVDAWPLPAVISLMLTERTLVRQEGEALHVKLVPEPPLPENVARPTELYANGELVSQWHE
jgi:hypothetical protein